MRYLSILLDVCVMPETMRHVHKYIEQKRERHTKHCFIIADKKYQVISYTDFVSTSDEKCREDGRKFFYAVM
jgi:hypothetical protein